MTVFPSEFESHLSLDRLSIFLFHGVTTPRHHPVRNYTRKHITADYFVQFCSALSQCGYVISLNDVLAMWNSGASLPPNCFAITFDDGFANNYTVACPILSDFNFPATFYITTGFLNGHTPSWIDAIEIALEVTMKKTVGHEVFGGVVPIRNSQEKQQLLNVIRERVKKAPSLNPLDFSEEICKSLEVNVMAYLDDDLDRKLNDDEVTVIAKDALFEVGGHSHTHRILSYLDSHELDFEISRSLEILKSITGQPTIHYSYPEGQPNSYNETVIAALKARGIEICPTAIHGTNQIGSDLFSLRRITVA